MPISDELLNKAANGYTNLLVNGDVVAMAMELQELRTVSQQSAMPSTPQDVIDFIGNNFNSMATSDNLENVKFSLSVHDLLSCFEQMINFPQIEST
jgi:hypothetical protein